MTNNLILSDLNMEEECLPINVAVRIRPEQKNEKNTLKCVYKDAQPPVVIVSDKRQGFAFDQIFSSDVDQCEVYNNLLKPMLSKVLGGYNCIILAYGQTGTGKTYTMGTDPQKLNSRKDAGLISRVLDDFFKESIRKTEIKFSISFIEIYNEKVFDLLTPAKTPLIVKGFNVKDMTCVQIEHNEEARHWLQVGGKNRHVRQMTQNASSSRSHGIFTVYYTRMDNGITSKLHLVDLAGSESAGRTGNIGTPLKEGTSINKGLLTMGRVFHALSHNTPVIPFRDSMLTRILHDSLKINNYISLLACVSPSEYDIAETIHTLRFADEAKSLRSKPQLESIVAEFDRSNPGVLGALEPLSTVRKKKRPLQLFTSTQCKRPVLSIQRSKINNSSMDSPTFTLSLDSLSVSTSTVLGDISNTRQEAMNFSPIVRKVKQIVNDKMNDSQVKDLISEIAEYTLNTTQLKRTGADISVRTRKQLDFDSPEKIESPNTTTKEDTFKIPVIPAIRRLKTAEPLNILPICSDNRRRSVRLSSRLSINEFSKFTPIPAPRISSMIKPKPKRVEELMDLPGNDSPFKLTRRSVRLSMRVMRNSPENTPNVRINGTIMPTPAPRTVKKRRYTRTVKNNILDTPEDVKMLSPRKQHKTKVLRNLNLGTEKSLQALATVGPKTAAQIMTFRKLSGEFKTIEDLHKIPTWQGKKFEKFMLANQLMEYEVHE